LNPDGSRMENKKKEVIFNLQGSCKLESTVHEDELEEISTEIYWFSLKIKPLVHFSDSVLIEN